MIQGLQAQETQALVTKVHCSANLPSDKSCLRDALREFHAHRDVVASSGKST
jgi:hypothetical protein